MQDIQELWLKYNYYSNQLASALGRTNNIVGEYAEFIVNRYYGGKLLNASKASADIVTPDGKKYQVKSRKIKKGTTTQLNVIRSWDFDFLVVILFDSQGVIKKALEIPVSVAKEFGVPNEHQNGWVITTTQMLICDSRNKDLTHSLAAIS
ncbi:MAG: hypothetical protein K2W88_16915 [Pararheinheimera sp.]|jgi:hypothetical protein|nr:hypothetical protein [Rheinheimera sp.]